MPQNQPSDEEIARAHARRVASTISCRDTDALPRVDGAGEVFELDGMSVQRMHNGLLVQEGGYLGTWTTEIISQLRGHHEPQEELAFHSVLERVASTEDSPTMVELGCYWSYYSLWFIHRTGGRAIGLEPDPGYMKVGQKNYEINGFVPELYAGAIAGEPSAQVTFLAESTGEEITVEGFTLESLMDRADLDRASIVLADIQGFETPLIAAAEQLVKDGRIRFMVISTHHHTISGSATTHQDLLAKVTAWGGHIVAEHTVGESFSGDGLVVVSFDDQDADLQVPISRARYRESYFGELEYDLAAVQELLHKTDDLLQRTRDLVTATTARAEHAERSFEAVSAELAQARSQAAAAATPPVSLPRRLARRIRRLVRRG